MLRINAFINAFLCDGRFELKVEIDCVGQKSPTIHSAQPVELMQAEQKRLKADKKGK